MSRRAPNPAADRAAQNTATLKSLLKLEANKVCADCKRNKHPRWASWNLGVFVCIRCSGIHRGMGTHISRVKSVDLDSWTEEQMQSILSWGNARANKYWEAKLAQGHAPSEGKIENFIRTKYELKRWCMEGPVPDPSTLDVEGDDDVPLNIVKEKQAIERKTSQRAGASAARQPPPPQQQDMMGDLIGGDDPVPQRSSTAGPQPGRVPPPKAEAAPPKTTNKDSLLGLDFLGEAPPPRPSSTSNTGSQGAAQSRPDLKQSILSLYASAPRPQVQQQQSNSSFGGMGSPTQSSHGHQGSMGGFNDAFSSLSMGGNTQSQKPADPFASFGQPSSTRSPPPPSGGSAFGNLSGGSFFDTKPAAPAQQAHQQKPSNSGFGDFGGFASAPATKSPPPAQSSSGFDDLLGLDSGPAPSQTVASPPPSKPMSPPANTSSSVFNLSSPPPQQPAQVSPPKPASAVPSFSTAGFSSGADVWGDNAWGAPEPAAPAPAPAAKSPGIAAPPSDFGGWGAPAAPSSGGFGQTSGGSFANTPIVPGAGGGFNPAPKVSADEEFGGWSSSAAPASGSKPAVSGFSAADDDLFSNVWS